MYYDPYDEEMQVKFHRTDPTGRIVPLEQMPAPSIGNLAWAIARVLCVGVTAALIAWWSV